MKTTREILEDLTEEEIEQLKEEVPLITLFHALMAEAKAECLARYLTRQGVSRAELFPLGAIPERMQSQARAWNLPEPFLQAIRQNFPRWDAQ